MFVEKNGTNKLKNVTNEKPRAGRRGRCSNAKRPANRGKKKDICLANGHVKLVHNLSKVPCSEIAGKYLTTNWEGQNNSDNGGVSIDGFKTIDSTDVNSMQIFDVSNPKVCVCAKLSRRLCQQHVIQKNRNGLFFIRQFAAMAMSCKPEVMRGKKCGGENSAYKIFGSRKDPKGVGVGTYAFKPKTSDEKQESVTAMAQTIVKQLETAAHGVTKPLYDDLSFVKAIRKHTGGIKNGIGEVSTAFSIGRDYHSKCHVDNDYYYTTLTVCTSNKCDDNTVIYYFCFPEYSVKIPLRSGDVLVFNPQILHSCSNPKLNGSFIMSAYVSAKTVHSSA